MSDGARKLSHTQEALVALMAEANANLRRAMVPAQIIRLALVAEERLFEAIVRWDDGHRSWSWSAVSFGGAAQIANAAITIHLLNRSPSVVDTFGTSDDSAAPYEWEQAALAAGYSGQEANPIDPEDEQTFTPPTDHRRLQ